MGLLDDMGRFLEERLDEFLRSHPHLELQALEEQLREQELKTQQLIQSLQRDEQRLEQAVLAIAADIKQWHGRITKAEQAKRWDLVNAAREREATLLRQGNQQWGQLAGIKQNLKQAQELLVQTQRKRQEVKERIAQMPASPTGSPPSDSTAWSQAPPYQAHRHSADPVEAQFREWELEEDLKDLKRNMGI